MWLCDPLCSSIFTRHRGEVWNESWKQLYKQACYWNNKLSNARPKSYPSRGISVSSSGLARTVSIKSPAYSHHNSAQSCPLGPQRDTAVVDWPTGLPLFQGLYLPLKWSIFATSAWGERKGCLSGLVPYALNMYSRSWSLNSLRPSPRTFHGPGSFSYLP